MCILDMGMLGPVPIPHFNNQCFGSLREFGSHVGDWEHTSFLFKVRFFIIRNYYADYSIEYRYRCTME